MTDRTDPTTPEGRAEMRAQFAAFADTDEVPLVSVKAGHLRSLLNAADQRDRYREALERARAIVKNAPSIGLATEKIDAHPF